MASVGHFEVESVGPERRILQGSSDRGIIKEGLLLHHDELIVATHPEEGRPNTNDRVIGDISKLLNDQPGASHLLGPLFHTAIAPVIIVFLVGDGMGCNLMTKTFHVLDSRVVGVLVGHKESSLNAATIGIDPVVEDFIIKLNVVVVDGIIKGNCDHLGDPGAVGVGGAEVTRNLGSVLRTEAVGKLTNSLITRSCSVRIGVSI